MIFEGLCDAFWQFLRSGHYDAQAAEGFGRAAAGVGVQKRWRGKEHAYGIFAHQRGDGLGVEGAGMKDGADSGHCRQAEGACEAEGVEEGEDAEDAVALVQVEDLLELFDVCGEIEMREYYALGFARGAAGKNDGGRVVERRPSDEAERAFEQSGGKQLRG